jgi:flagellar hook protein FlgE
LDVDGYLTDPNGLFVNGWDAVPDEANPGQQKINKVKATPIQIAADDNYIQPEMTTYIRADGNLNPYTEPERETSISFYDSLGTRYTSDVKFKFIAPGALDDAGNEIPAGDPRIGRWSVQMKNYMQVGTDNEKVLVGVTTPAASIPEGSDERAQLNSAITGLAPFGIMQIETQAQPAAGQEAPESWIDIGTISFTDMGNLTTYDTTATVPPPENPQIDAYMSSLVFTVTDTAETLAPESRFDETITWNFEDVTQFNGASTFTNITKDGNEPGTLSQVSIGADGILMGSYSNGSTKEIAQISIATFVNPTGLTKTGNNLFQSTRNSGEFDGVGKTVYDAGSTIMGGVLEMSNVDLGFEFTEMITAQRGFQANSRTITTSDEILQELVNLKR